MYFNGFYFICVKNTHILIYFIFSSNIQDSYGMDHPARPIIYQT